jgi:hypothetical protein
VCTAPEIRQTKAYWSEMATNCRELCNGSRGWNKSCSKESGHTLAGVAEGGNRTWRLWDVAPCRLVERDRRFSSGCLLPQCLLSNVGYERNSVAPNKKKKLETNWFAGIKCLFRLWFLYVDRHCQMEIY